MHTIWYELVLSFFFPVYLFAFVVNSGSAKQTDLGDELDSDKEVEEEEDDGPLNDCLICGRRVRHNESFCPYLDFVPHNAYLPPGIQRICKCCGNRDGHPGEKWKACAILKECANCDTYAQHWTEDCPTNARKEQ